MFSYYYIYIPYFLQRESLSSVGRLQSAEQVTTALRQELIQRKGYYQVYSTDNTDVITELDKYLNDPLNMSIWQGYDWLFFGMLWVKRTGKMKLYFEVTAKDELLLIKLMTSHMTKLYILFELNRLISTQLYPPQWRRMNIPMILISRLLTIMQISISLLKWQFQVIHTAFIVIAKLNAFRRLQSSNLLTSVANDPVSNFKNPTAEELFRIFLFEPSNYEIRSLLKGCWQNKIYTIKDFTLIFRSPRWKILQVGITKVFLHFYVL